MSKHGNKAYTEAERIEAFWDKVKKTDNCWEWIAGKYPNGYGLFWDGNRHVRAHRFVYNLERGQIGDLCVLHHCDNRGCVNPAHLFLGTKKDNVQDCVKKGRFPRNENHGQCKLTDAEVAEIRTRANDWLQRELAAEYGVSRPHISDIIHRKRRALPTQAA